MASVYVSVDIFGVCRLDTSRWSHDMMKMCDLFSSDLQFIKFQNIVF
jgi:hypothetical protein